MKRTILLFATVLFFTTLSAQPFLIKDKNGNNVTSDTIVAYGMSPDGGMAVGADVTNNTETPRNVLVRKEHIYIPEGITVMMCWKSCYAPDTYITPEYLTIQPGETKTEFVEDFFYPAETFGIFTVKYVFFDMDNTRDSSYVVIKHIIGGVGVKENIAKSVYISNAYPNPAVSIVNLDFKLPVNASNAKIQISNLLGTSIKVIDLNTKEGKASINISDLKNGVYFYSLTINNSATITRKFVVKR